MAFSPEQLLENPQPASPSTYPEDDPLKRADIRDSYITFKNPQQYAVDLQILVSRMHRNLGHLSAGELKKLMAMNGITIMSRKVLSAVDDLGQNRLQHQCLDPTSDEIQLDIVYIRDIAGHNYPVLGIIDECTHLHQACLLESRLPEEISRKFTQAWAQPFSFPLVCRLDAEGSFGGAFEEYLDTTGTFTDYVPPGAH